jgi:hypothetical protein
MLNVPFASEPSSDLAIGQGRRRQLGRLRLQSQRDLSDLAIRPLRVVLRQ